MINDELLIHHDERIDEFSDLKVIQKINGPHFSLDAVLLARFARVKDGDMVVDLGTGGGIISLILAKSARAKAIVGIEIQQELVDIARRNVILNQMENKIEIIQADLREINKTRLAGTFDLLVSNPPYRRLGDGRINPDHNEAIARHEIKCTLEDVLKAIFYLLKEGGKAFLIYRPDRIVDIISGCRDYRIEPKKIQIVYPAIDRGANLVLIEAVKNAQSGLTVLSPVIVSGHEIPLEPIK